MLSIIADQSGVAGSDLAANVKFVAGGAPTEGIGKTAFGIALIRAEETSRPDRLFDDPLASAFLDSAPEVFAEEQQAAENGTMTAWGIAFRHSVTLRTRFYDDYLLDSAAGGTEQVVLLAAGLDTRAFRLAWPAGVHLFELDLPDMLEFKRRVLADHDALPRCHRTVVTTDLRGPWGPRLIESGFRPDRPTAWLFEGLLIYLSPAEAANLLAAVTALSASGSRIAFGYESYGSEAKQVEAKRLETMSEYAPLWKGGLPDTAGWLSARGWTHQRHDRRDLASSYGRLVPDGVAGGFVVSTRSKPMSAESRRSNGVTIG